MRITSSGNVGIGTTNPGATLHVKASDDSTNALAFWVVNKAHNNSIISAYENGDVSLGTLTYKDTSGNVGIGTTSPIARLNIANTIADSNVFTISRAENATVSLLSIFQDSSWDIGGGQGSGIAHINTNNRNLAITTSSDQSLDGGIFINESGNVGIGTTSPGARLDILGPNSTGTFFSAMNAGAGGTEFKRVNSNSYPYNHFLFYNGRVGIGTTNPGYNLDVQQSDGSWASRIYNTGSSGDAAGLLVRTDATASDNASAFGIFTDGAYKFLVKSTGNVGISTTDTSSYKLHVNGSVFASSYYPTSDDRVKHNEQPIVGALETLSKITPKKYIKTTEMYDVDHDFKLDSDGNPIDENGESVEHRIEAGVIAQQVLTVDELAFAVTPEGVDEDENATRPHGLDYNSLFTYAIAAIQEQQKLIEDLRGEVEVLKKQIN
jgi:hypothetical protein